MKGWESMYDHGIIAGKFFPLHSGHDHLIRKGLSLSRRLTIFVVASAKEEPSADIRADWVRRAYPTANVRKIANLTLDDSTRDSNVQWARYTNHILEGDMPDVVFSSEDYAKGWAEEMGAQHVMIDHERSLYAISGTQIRNDPYYYFHLIHEVAKPFYTKKVLLVGAESTGKTTLTVKLANDYSTHFVPEFGRIFVERHVGKDGDMEPIKRCIFPEIINEQQRMEDELLLKANRVLFCDTDLYTTWLWYLKWQPDNVDDALGALILEEAKNRTYDLILVMDHVGTKWVDDGLRDQEDSREWFTDRLIAYNANNNLGILNGTWDEREARAKRLINRLFRETKAILPT